MYKWWGLTEKGGGRGEREVGRAAGGMGELCVGCFGYFVYSRTPLFSSLY